MKHLSILSLGVIVCLSILISCSKNLPTGAAPEASPPDIQSLRVSPLNVIGGSTVTVAADVVNDEEALIEYEWSVSKGSLIGTTLGPEVLWTTPNEGSVAFITCRVLNESGHDEVTAHVFLASQQAPTVAHMYQTGSNPWFYIQNAAPAADGGCFTLSAEETGFGSYQLAKQSPDGVMQWETTFYSNWLYQGIVRVEGTPDGGCIVSGLGDQRPDDSGSAAIKYGASGNILWTANTGTETYWVDLEVDDDGNSTLFGIHEDTIGILKITIDGEISEQQTFPNPDDPWGYPNKWNSATTSDGGYVMSRVESFGADHLNSLLPVDLGTDLSTLFKFASDGDLVWSKSYDDNRRGVEIREVIDSKSGYIIIAGAEWSWEADSSRNYDLFIEAIDYNGNPLFLRQFPDINAGSTAMNEFEDGSIGVAAGFLNGCTMLTFDGAGNLLWMKQENTSSPEAEVHAVWKHAGEFFVQARASYYSELAPGFMLKLSSE